MIERDTDLQIGTKPPCTIHEVVCSTGLMHKISIHNQDFMKAIKQDTTNLDKFEKIANDGTIQDYHAFSLKWLNAIKPHLQEKNAWYFFNGDTKMREFLNAINEAGFYFSQLLIWNKGAAVMGRKDYQPMHELIFYGWYGKHKYFGTKDKSILQCPKPKANKLHPTMKPPELLRKLIYHSSESGSIVYEPFAGSGSTMVACEQLGRICYMIELDAKYCETIVKRYRKLNPKGIVTINGKPLNE